jgi:erythronate-4-phosphate dehydrogenase
LDVWDSEPNIDVALAQNADIATGHIAGNSFEGKRRAVAILRRSYQKWRRNKLAECNKIKRASNAIRIKDAITTLNTIILSAYDVLEDDLEFRAAVLSDKNVSEAFDRYRRNYRGRYEFADYQVTHAGRFGNDLKALGFTDPGSSSTKSV